MIKINNLDFSYPTKKVLNNINVEFSKGEIVGLIGANGSGKSTLLKCISGIHSTNQEILIDDKYIEDYTYKEKAKKITLMNQSVMLNFDFKCYDIIAMGRYTYLDITSDLKKEDEKIIEKQMEFANTLKYKDVSFNKLSGGQKQRVMFTKTLVQQTPYILFDEPTSAQDIKYENIIFSKLKSLSKQKCIIVTVHNLSLAVKYCDRLILLADGDIISDGSVEEVINKENLKKAYDIDSVIYRNEKTGLIDFFIK